MGKTHFLFILLLAFPELNTAYSYRNLAELLGIINNGEETQTDDNNYNLKRQSLEGSFDIEETAAETTEAAEGQVTPEVPPDGEGGGGEPDLPPEGEDIGDPPAPPPRPTDEELLWNEHIADPPAEWEDENIEVLEGTFEIENLTVPGEPENVVSKGLDGHNQWQLGEGDVMDKELSDWLADEENGVLEKRATRSKKPITFGHNIDNIASSHDKKRLRSGQATNTDSCRNVRSVPSSVRKELSINSFYAKYTEVYGIPVIGSRNVTSEGLSRACYVVKIMFASRYDVRNAYYKMYGRVALIGDGEQVTSLYEYRTWDKNYWDSRARGLGATVTIPMCSAGDDNMRCKANGRYFDQDIMVHELAHGVHLLGCKYAIQGFDTRLSELYERTVKKEKKWAGTYASENMNEYFAVASQFYFDAFKIPGEYKKWVENRATLRRYDPKMAALLDEVYPCSNELIHRCSWKACNTRNFKLHPKCNKASKCKSHCPVIKASYSKNTAAACAAMTCYYLGNAFNWQGSTCEVLKCPNTKTDTGLMLKQGVKGGMSVYTGVNLPKMDLSKETRQDVKQYCTTLSGNCNLSKNEKRQCGDKKSVKKSSTCKDMGCCWVGGGCYYPKQVCKDQHIKCADLAREGECKRNPNFMYRTCSLSCGICSNIKNYNMAELAKKCQDKNLDCKAWGKPECKSNPGYMNPMCPLTCGKCSLRG